MELENSYTLGFSLPHVDHKYDWAYFSEPEKHLDARRMYCPRDRICGGSVSSMGWLMLEGTPLLAKQTALA